MSGLQQAIADLKSSVEDAGWKVFDHVPEKVAPPAIYIGAGDPYLTQADVFDVSQMVINLELVLVVKKGANSAEVKDLNAMLQAVLPHLGDWTASVGQPQVFTVNQSLYLGAIVAVSNTFDLG